MTTNAPRFHRSNAHGTAPGGHYSHAVAAGGFVFVSGQLPTRPGVAPDPSMPVREQTTLTLQNLQSALQAAGAKLTDVVKVTAWLRSEDDWDDFDAAYAAFFGDHRPARAAVPVGRLHYGLCVEIEAVAFVGSRGVTV
ncbi:MAG: RidA family protein [Planctomycetes bacterium]|nr:RidA family protein [Planctomycetota bacterium]